MKKMLIGLGGGVTAGLMLISFAAAQTTVSPVPAGTTPVPPIRICPHNKVLRQGSSGDDVKALQSLLSEDKTIYPEGLKTGYYGSLTAEAVRRLQEKAGLEKTGIIDDDTRAVLFPCMTLRVVSPNGGEVWNALETHDITWQIEAPYYILSPSAGTEGKLREVPTAAGAQPPADAVKPFYPHLSIDLVRTDLADGRVFHIGGASIYGDRSFKWTIPQNIPESKSYKVRISVWKNLPNPIVCTDKTKPCPLAPQAYPIQWQGYLWDESDSEFAILGGKPDTTPMPTAAPIDYGKLKALRQQIVETIDKLQKTLQLIDELLGITSRM